MTGIEGLGDRAMAGRPGPAAARKAADFNQLGLQVDTENVLGIYAAIAQEVKRLQTSLRNFQRAYGDGMPRLGGDPVSPPAATAFNESTNKLVALAKSDVDDLDRVAQGLADAAKAYGKSEEQLTAAFDPGKFVYVPAPVQRTPADLPQPLRGLVTSAPSLGGNPLRDVFGGDPR